jgi:hypothetical protein
VVKDNYFRNRISFFSKSKYVLFEIKFEDTKRVNRRRTDKYNGQKKDRQTNKMDKRRRTDRQIQWSKEGQTDKYNGQRKKKKGTNNNQNYVPLVETLSCPFLISDLSTGSVNRGRTDNTTVKIKRK